SPGPKGDRPLRLPFPPSLPRSEEKCLVRSGLVQLMDRLCSLSSQTESSSSEKQTKKQKVAIMAWAAFQVLANRCVEWEKEEGGSTEAVHSGLARQVSSLLTNHLARATECCGNQAAGNDALQDVLSLLNDLSRYRVSQLWRLEEAGTSNSQNSAAS
ncbi:probable E3 ubiquitin-protein ligase HECTD4, partial [Notechis scutatus]|uniref:Probable E3 ubiquitin-protein ligase HECTD4 n=1 Tax=Notechis scutatus TaxID=8663 RepID=A0A6J1W605_9SAUR